LAFVNVYLGDPSLSLSLSLSLLLALSSFYSQGGGQTINRTQRGGEFVSFVRISFRQGESDSLSLSPHSLTLHPPLSLAFARVKKILQTFSLLLNATTLRHSDDPPPPLSPKDDSSEIKTKQKNL